MKLEEYLRSQPFTSEAVASLATEENLAAEMPVPVIPGAIGQYERDWLKHLQNEPGYRILLKLLENIVLRYEDRARLLSQSDPLGNKEAVANSWAYAAIAKIVSKTLQDEIEAEILKA